MFLLEGLKRDGCKDKISVLYHKKAIVYTSAQKSVSDFINQRIRWASKSRYYTDRDIMLSGIIVLAANIILIVVLAMAFFEKHNLYNFFVVMGIKTFADLIILMPITRFFQRVFNPFIFSLLTIIYPFYSLFTVLASWRGTYKWKGRCIK
jgi:cellulose synthase/poly-beta-1,6-N-acetylglucosamine synthase-like glycosyltransferase